LSYFNNLFPKYENTLTEPNGFVKKIIGKIVGEMNLFGKE
jgi:hypothetical protein